jgi:hypothetical protein
MIRPLVGIEEEPSELERICLRVREARENGCSIASQELCPPSHRTLSLYPSQILTNPV